ncbi:Aminopeptidase N [Porphyridium purpureum]|uniref:Aminopeptidase N n=1 Tax=Porphyridium purpureum TaxID=35688 RepID=A0A5J4YT76_PORPP|nr:Aminopeptidase N [Porphyridium purpureum]|eukprot:POR0150..scf229_5
MPHLCGLRHAVELHDGGDVLASGGGEFTLRPDGQKHYRPDLPLEPMHLKIELNVDLEKKKVHGCVAVSVQSKCADAKRCRVLKLHAVDFDSGSVRVECDTHPIQQTDYNGKVIAILFAEPVPLHETAVVKVFYSVTDPRTGMSFSYPTPSEPQRGKFMCTDHETERARYWLPCIDHPSVRTTLEFVITTQREWTVLCNGTEGPEQPDPTDPSLKVSHWRLDCLCPSYLICMGVGDLVEARDGDHKGKPIAYYASRAFYKEEHLIQSFGRTGEMLDWMTNKLDFELPWPKYYQIAVGGGVGSAMENISLVTWDDACLHDGMLDQERGWLIDCVNVHEMGHTYFGDLLVMSDFASAWLKESWASYIEACWVEHKFGADTRDCYMWMERNQYMSEADERYVRPISTKQWDSSWLMFDSHLYPGGSWRIHMLRGMLGDDLFWAGVRKYIKDNAWGTVETHDFRVALERVSNLSLECFFDQWIFGLGYPKLKVSVQYEMERGQLTLTMKQTQVDTTKKIELFAFELSVSVEVDEGQWAHKVAVFDPSKNAGCGTVCFSDLAKKPLQIAFDPHALVLFKPDQSDVDLPMLCRAASHPPSSYARLLAIEALAAQGSSTAVNAIVDTYKQESGFLERRLIVEQLAKVNSNVGVRALCECLQLEKDPRVLYFVVMKVASVRDLIVAETLEAFVRSADASTPRVAMQFALQGLGAQRDSERALALLNEYATDDARNPWWVWIKRGAILGLGQLRSPEAYEALAKLAPDGAISFQAGLRAARSALMGALGTCVEFADKPLRDKCAYLLLDIIRNDPDYYVRRSAAGAISQLGDTKHAAAALRLFEKQATNQDEALAERYLRKLGGDAELGGVKKELDEQKSELRSLKSQLEELKQKKAAAE